jgi:hypothetical protein
LHSQDHFPLLFDCIDIIRSIEYFKFKDMWLKSEDFLEKVKQWCLSYNFKGTPRFVLTYKLKAFKLDLKKWNEEVFGKC